MESSRSRRLVQMALDRDPTDAGTSTGDRRYSLVKLLEEGRFVIVPYEYVRMTEINDLHMTTYNNREYLCLIFNTGGLREIQDMLEILTRFKTLEGRFKYLSSSSSNTQTQIPDIYISRMDAEAQTDQSFPAETSLTGVILSTNVRDLPGTIQGNGSITPLLPMFLKAIHSEKMHMPVDTNPPTIPEHIFDEKMSERRSDDKDETMKQRSKRRMQYCIYCKKELTALRPHLITVHKDEEEVRIALNLPNKERNQAFGQIRRKGYVEKHGEIQIRRGAKTEYLPCQNCGASYSKASLYKHYNACTGKRPPKTEYLPCQNCGASYSKASLYKHYNVCTGKRPPKNLQAIAKQTKNIKSKNVELMCETLKNHIIPGMSCNADVFDAITTKKYIIDFGNRLCRRFGDAEAVRLKNLIRLKLRNLAKIRLGLSKLLPDVTCILEVFNVKHWDKLVTVIADLSHLGDKSKRAPTTVRNLGLLISNAAKDIKASLLPKSEERVQIKAWIELFERAVFVMC